VRNHDQRRHELPAGGATRLSGTHASHASLDVAHVQAVLKQFRLPAARAGEALILHGVADVVAALEHFAELLPPTERPTEALELLEFAASTNAFEPIRLERELPITLAFYSSVHPAYYEGEGRIGEAPWRLCYTDGGAIGASPARERMLDEVIRLAEAMHDKNPFGEVPFDGGKTVLVQEGAVDGASARGGNGATGRPGDRESEVASTPRPSVAASPSPPFTRFQAVTALYGDVGMSLFILGKGGLRYYSIGAVTAVEKKVALTRWAASSALAGILAHKYIGGPDMRMGVDEMGWVDAAAAEIGAARQVRQHPAVTGLAAAAGGFPHQSWELTGRTVVASFKEALRHPAMARYGLDPAAPIRVLIQGFGDVGGSVARLLTQESPEFQFRIAGVADEFGALYRTEGLDTAELLRLRAARQPLIAYAGPLDALWVGSSSEADRRRHGFRGTDSRELILQPADVFIPAAIPNVIDASVAPRLQVRLVAEGANNAVAPQVERLLHEQGILYLPGQALNWGGVKASTLEALFRELTKRTAPLTSIEERVRAALTPLGSGVDLAWTMELLRSGLPGPPLDQEETRAFAIAILEDLARSNTRWLMNELAASRYARPPLDLVRTLSRTVRVQKVQLLSLIEEGLGREFFAPDTSLQRLKSLLDDKLKELLTSAASDHLTATQVTEQRQMLQQLQNDVANGLSPIFASLLAALDLARQKVMDPDGYSQESLRRDLTLLRRADAPLAELEESLYRLQRVHPGPNRAEFVRALVHLLQNLQLSPVVRRNAALAIAKLGSADPAHQSVLLAAASDPDLSVRAASRWALNQMAIAPPGMQ
jgi:glutamate dehydrogenase/leucine dehydrogenase